jgi:hypothetical protein
MSEDLTTNLIRKLDDYVTQEQWKGYDPYDIMNSSLPLSWLGKYPLAVLTQVQKRIPFNWRPLLGIKKEHNPKGMGLFLMSYAMLYELTGDLQYKTKADTCYEWLLSNRSQGFSGSAWGYNFAWANPRKIVPKCSPNIVVTGFVAKGIFAYYRVFPEKKDIALIHDIVLFIQENLAKTEDETGLCYSYTTLERDICYNASLQAAEIFAWYGSATGDEQYKRLAEQVCNFVVHRQNADGSWDYSESVGNGTRRVQLDFHQGYILDSLRFVQEHIATTAYNSAIKKGFDFYRQNLVNPNGSTPYRYPAPYPVDIHNQAQAIITLSQFGDMEHAEYCLTFTAAEMRSKRGYFYYKKYPKFTIRTPYIRWSQAWMLLAMVYLKKASLK